MPRTPHLPSFEPNAPTINLSRLADVDRARAAVPPSVANRLYRPTWALLFVISLSYLAIVAFAPGHLPGRLAFDIDTPSVAAPVPTAPVVIAAAPSAPPSAQPAPPPSNEPVRPTVINNPTPKQASPIETGALPKGQVPSGAFGVQIGNAPSLDTLHLVWTRMVERHRANLAGTEPRFIATEANLYTLVAGPYATEAEARRVCADIAARNDQCRVRPFAGDALF